MGAILPLTMASNPLPGTSPMATVVVPNLQEGPHIRAHPATQEGRGHQADQGDQGVVTAAVVDQPGAVLVGMEAT